MDKQLAGAVVSEASQQSGLSRMSLASTASTHAQHNLNFKHCGAPVGPRHTGTFALFDYKLDPHETPEVSWGDLAPPDHGGERPN